MYLSGVNIKYYFNQSTNHGICQCSQMCSGKGCGLGDGQCKRITILIFMSGEVIITGIVVGNNWISLIGLFPSSSMDAENYLN